MWSRSPASMTLPPPLASASSSVVPPPRSPVSMSPSPAEASDISDEKPGKTGSKPPKPLKDYIHVRARRGQATDSYSLAEDRRHLQTSQPNTRPPALLLQSEPFADICFFDTWFFLWLPWIFILVRDEGNFAGVKSNHASVFVSKITTFCELMKT
ncbi:uncharacterized protein LOC133710581 [Rosa rugosa]|uniref:uncharacterized protein LOC133710581 n=1 Tax=Rosa rugosa TaxID=74645 RepID=UPI002B410BDE|nr:uncharacterized protein LOC133710581 [Rosa rugosa]